MDTVNHYSVRYSEKSDCIRVSFVVESPLDEIYEDFLPTSYFVGTCMRLPTCVSIKQLVCMLLSINT